MSALSALIAAELEKPVAPAVAAFAADIAARYGDASRAVLFYGSCLRSDRLEGEMLDFYLIVSDYRAAYGKSWLAPANRMLPPNVFPVAHDGLVGKVAVLSEADFHALNRHGAGTVSVWARFAQPSRLVWAKDARAKDAAVRAIEGAAPRLLDGALAFAGGGGDLLDLWRTGFSLTYGAELRAERADRPGSVVDHAPDYYRRVGAAALGEGRIKAALGDGGEVRIEAGQERALAAERARWPALRRRGKLVTLARLAKASFTYAGGVDYLAWKINRHAGTKIVVKPWQRRFPLLGAIVLLPVLIARGAVK